MDDDGVYNSVYTKTTGDWVLSITFVEREEKMYISISTIGRENLSPYLEASQSNKEELAGMPGEVSFTMLEIIGEYGNGFVFKLPNGHFIVNDGGNPEDAANLVAVLKEQAGTDKVIIDAWIFTHLHMDHSGAAWTMFTDASLREDIRVNGIYLSEPNLKVETMYEDEYNQANNTFRGLMTLTQDDGKSKPAVYRMHMGERYYFSGMTVDVVQAQEQIPSTTYQNLYGDSKIPDYINTMSTNCVYTLKSSGKKILLGGDSTNINMQYMMNAYGKSYTDYAPNSQQYGGTSKTLSNINVFAAYHHGKNAIATYESGYTGESIIRYNTNGTATNEWADYLLRNTNHVDRTNYKFDIMLFPYNQVFDMKKYTQFTTNTGTKYNFIWGGDDGSVVYPYNLSDINKYYIQNSNSYYTYGLDEYDMNGNELTNVQRHGSVQFIFKADKSVETIVDYK